ncbi:MAG: phosphotriesterase-related protein, partial [Dehalococcoidia bacterium]
MATTQTVLGPLDGSQLGVVLSHEHVLISMGEDARHYPWMYDWQRTRANVVRELRE